MTTLYRLYGPSDELLYVGISANALAHFNQHASNKPWWSQATRIRLEHHPDRPTALQAERQAIVTERPRYNIVHNRRRRPNTPPEQTPVTSNERTDRLTQVTTGELRPDSLVGSFFHSEAERGWQGCIVAEPAPGTYLIELFEWFTGSSTQQQLISVDQMTDWQFYDTADWMIATYEHGLGDRWERQRNGDAKTSRAS